MIERLQGRVEKISMIEHVGESLDLCEIQIGFDTFKIFYDHNDLMDFVDCDVVYTTRKDVVRGVPDLVICELAKLSTIQTVKSTENIKLVPEGTKRTMCNFDIKGARYGNYYPGVTALMSSYQLGSSAKARWFDCTLIDMYSREFVVRKFESDGTLENIEPAYAKAVGKYVTFDMESTRYGFQTKEIVVLPQEVELSPEVVVAKSVLEKAISEDPALAEYCSKYDLIQCLLGKIDGEPGYTLVRMASELYMINAIDNITVDLNIQAMKRAVFCSRGYLLPHKTEWSIPLLNNTKVVSVSQLKTDREMLLILDPLSREEASPTKLTYIKIRGLVNNIIDIRRGVENEKDIADIASAGAMFNGLL